MVKPDKCSYCSSAALIFKENHPVFNPDTDEDDIHNCWACNECNTIHVNNSDYQFFMVEINPNKTLQMHDDCQIA